MISPPAKPMLPLVIYHAACNDGFCAAWLASNYFQGETECVPWHYGTPPPDVTGRRVWILDFSFKREILREMALSASTLVVLDHHKTAQEDLEGLLVEREHFVPFKMAPGFHAGDGTVYGVLDMTKSGARLTHEHFFPNNPLVPWLVAYTEDRDLWRHALPSSKAVNAALASYQNDFAVWNRLATRDPLGALRDEGEAILRYQEQQIERMLDSAREREFTWTEAEEEKGAVVWTVNTCVHISEVAGRLAEGRPFGACWFVRGDGKKQWSLRSRKDGVDVSLVAKHYGGGGHRHSAGFAETIE